MLKGPILEYRQGGGACAWAGLVIAAFGFFLLSGALSLFGLSMPGEPLALYIAGATGTLLSLVGLLLALGRSAIEVDRQKERVLLWKGLLLPLFTKRYDFSVFRAVSVKLKIVEGSDSFELFEVYLVGKADEDTVEVESFTDYAQARVEAEKLARFLQLPVEDRSQCDLETTPFAELNLLLAERAKGSKREEPKFLPALQQELPQSLVINQENENNTEVTIMPLGFTPQIVVATIIALVFFAAIFWNIFLPFLFLMGPETGTPPFVRYVFTPFMLLFMCGPLTAVAEGFIHAYTKEKIRIEKGRFFVEQIAPFSKKEEALEISAVRDIVINESKTSDGKGSVIVIGEGEVLSLGNRLSTADRQQLRALLSRLVIDAQK